MRKRKGVSQQQEHMNCVNANQRSGKVKYGSRTWWGTQRGPHVCCQRINKVKHGRPISWGMQMGLNVCQRWDEVKHGRRIGRGMQRGAHVCQRSDGVKYGRPSGRGMQRDAHVCQRSDEVKYCRPIRRGMQRGAHVWQRSNMQRMACIISIYYCWIISLLIVFGIIYHAVRQIIERPCHLLSHAVRNSKLTTLPQSQRRWHPSWQRILKARRIIERLTKDPVTLFHNMTWLTLGHAWAQWDITCRFMPYARRETLPFWYVP